MARKNKKEKIRRAIVAVCPFHPDTIMKKHIITNKDSKVTKGVHCPKCFCATSKLVIVEIKPKVKANKTSA